MRTHNTGVVTSNSQFVLVKAPLVRKATRNYLINPTSLEKSQSPVSGFYYARNGICNAVQLQRANMTRHLLVTKYITSVKYICGGGALDLRASHMQMRFKDH